MITVDIQYATESKMLPPASALQHWVKLALSDHLAGTTLTLRIVDIPEITQLNLYYRGKNKPTNVLSFPYAPQAITEENLLGDVVICAPVVVAEAAAQNKHWEAHWAHLVLHGCLHLVGFDHVTETQATVMESLEVKLLATLGFANPYLAVSRP